MSGDAQPSFFSQDTNSQNADYYDDILGRENLDIPDFDHEYCSGSFQWLKEESERHQAVVSAGNASSQGESQAGLSNEDSLPQDSQNEFGESQEDVSSFQNATADHDYLSYVELGNGPEELPNPQYSVPVIEHVSHDQTQAALLTEEHQSQLEPNEFVEDRGQASSLQNAIPANSNLDSDQPELGLPDTAHQSPAEPNDLFQDEEGIPDLHTTSAPDVLRNGQPEDGLANSQQEPDFEIDMSASEEWQNLVASGTFSVPGPGVQDEQRIQEHAKKAKQSGTPTQKSLRQQIQTQFSPLHHAPSPQGIFDASAASPNLHSVEHGEGSVVNTPGMDSGYGTLNPSREATFGPLSATPYQTSTAVQHSGSDNVLGDQGPVYSSHHTGTYNARTEGATTEVVEDDPNFNPADDLNHYTEDPTTGVIESRRRNGWGRTGTRNGVEVWLNPQTKQWQESASHHSYREILIARAQAEQPGEGYLHPDDTDDLPHGETAFYLPHQNFCPSRDDCPNECFVWTEHESDDDESEVEETEKKSRAMKKRKLNPRPRRPDPGFWFEDNKILLDPHNNPVRKHPDMPLTLSSMTEGYKLDLMRILNAGISQRDEWARMPRWIRRQVPKTDTFVIKYIGSPNTHVNMPSLRFREEKGAAAGNNREGTKKIRKGLKALFAEHGFDPSLTGSTRGFGRDLFSWEQAMVKFGNKGKYPGRAGETRALNKETREENLEKTKKKIERGRKKAEAEASKTDAASAKRPREDQDGSYRNSNPAPQKSKSGGRPRTSGREQTPLQPQRYGTYGSGQMPIPNPNTLEAGHRSYYGAHGAAPSPYQNTNAFGGNQHVPSLGNSQYIRSRNVPSYSGIGHELEASLNEPELESRGQTWSAQGPITQNHYPRAQYQQQHDFSSGHMNNNQYGPPVQHQGLSRGQNGAPKYRGGTLGPGGRKIYQAPKQVLGRRGREDSGEVNDVVYRNNQEAAQAGTPVPNAREVETSRTTGPQQVGQPHASEYQAGELEYSVRASQFSDDDAPSKRRRNNQNPGTESRPERRLHHGKAPRPQYYGATGAPIPLMPPESVFETVPYFNGNAGVQDFGNYHQNGWVANTGLGGQASYEYKPYSNDGSHGLVAVSNENGDRGMRHMQAQHKREFGPILFPPGQASYDPYAPQPHLPQNTDGAPNGDFDSYGGRLRGYAPPQALGKRDRPDLDSESFEGSLSPAEKRRRMPSTQGYHLPPGTQRRAEKKLRKSKRDENLPPFVFNVDVGGPNAQHGSHAAATSDVNEAVPIAYQAPQVPNAQGPVPPLVSTPAPTGQIPITDIRNTPPATEYECMRLQEALECTRWAYEQWTGMAAPETNIFDSYNAQFGVIFQSFHIWWASGSNPERSQSVEWLVQLDPWEGSVADWKPLAPDFFFYECVRRGFYAPRNLDGSLQQS